MPASIRRECVEAGVRGHTVTIRVYGPGRDVFDHHDLVGRLLEPDLVALESSARGHALRSAVPGSSLDRPTRTFLASELNALIAEAAPQIDDDVAGPGGRAAAIGRVLGQALLLAPAIRRFRRAGVLMKLLMLAVAFGMLLSPQIVGWYAFIAVACVFYERRYQRDRPRAVAAETPSTTGDRSATVVQAAINDGLVTADYVRRARAAVGRALPCLYGPLMVSGGLWLTAALTVLFLVAKQTFIGWPVTQKALPLLGVTGVAWFLLERRASASLEAMLGAPLYARLKTRFSATRSFYRLVPLAGFLLAWFVADVLVNLVARWLYPR